MKVKQFEDTTQSKITARDHLCMHIAVLRNFLSEYCETAIQYCILGQYRTAYENPIPLSTSLALI